MNQRSFARIILFFSLGIFIGGACNKKSAVLQSPNISVQINSIPKSLHPIGGIDAQRRDILFYTYQSLIRINPITCEREPLLAALPKVSEDGLTYTYQIYPAAKWPDGSKITAKDVAFSIKAAACELVRDQAGITDYLIGIEELILDSQFPQKIGLKMKKVNILNKHRTDPVNILKRKYFDPENILEQFSLAEVMDYLDKPEKSLAEHPDIKKWTKFINASHFSFDPQFMQGGSGPYQVTEWVPGQRITLSRVPSYWGAKLTGPLHQQEVEEISYLYISDMNSLELRLKQQNIDVVPRISTILSDRLKNNKAVNNTYFKTYQTGTDYAYIAFNLNPDGMKHKAIFKDINVRKAFSYITPMEDLIPDFYGGKAVQVSSPVFRHDPAYNSELEFSKYNLQEARTILEANGWKDRDGDLVLDKKINGKNVRLSIELLYPIGPKSAEDIATRLAAEGKKIGFEIKPKAINFGLLLKRLPNKDFDAVMLASRPGFPYDFHRDWATDGGANIAGFSNAEADSIIAIIPTTLNDSIRYGLMRRVQAIINEEQPVLFFFNTPCNMLINKRLHFKEANPMKPYILLNTLSNKQVKQASR